MDIKELDKHLKNLKPATLKAMCGENVALWVMIEKLLVDHRPFNFEHHKYLIDIYECEDHEICVMKAAQMGLTIWLLLKVLHILLYKGPIKAGIYFPTADGAIKMSKDRLTPLIMDNPGLRKRVVASQFTDTLGLKQIGQSSLYITHTGGVASKDSMPLDLLAFDEVRLIDPRDLDQALERVSHASDPDSDKEPYKFYISTAGLPGTDIHARFMRGDQRYWHTKCGCGDKPEDWVILSDVFPECVIDDGSGDYYLRCPQCGFRINDPQNGAYVAHNPGAPYTSFNIHQMMSKYIPLRDIMSSFQTTSNISEFVNAKLGKPYIDEENVPVTDDILAACVNTQAPWGKAPPENVECTGMGIDQRGGQNHVVIGQKLKNSKVRIIHVEEVDSKNPVYHVAGHEVSPFQRCYQLMREYDVDTCVCDLMPNTNESAAFARAFPGRVFLATYSPTVSGKSLAVWGDRVKNEDTRIDASMRNKYTVKLDRYRSVEHTLSQWVKRRIEIPDPKGLVQNMRDKRGIFTGALPAEKLFKHLKGVVRQNVGNDTDQRRMVWVDIGEDPHMLHSCGYFLASISRSTSNFNFSFI